MKQNTNENKQKTKKVLKFFFFLIVVQPFGLHNITELRADVFFHLCLIQEPFRGSRASEGYESPDPSGAHESKHK